MGGFCVVNNVSISREKFRSLGADLSLRNLAAFPIRRKRVRSDGVSFRVGSNRLKILLLIMLQMSMLITITVKFRRFAPLLRAELPAVTISATVRYNAVTAGGE